MQIKRYEALSVKEAVRKIKVDLGPDAIMLSTRSLKGKVEVFAARDDPGLGIKTGLGIEKGGMMESDMFALFKTEIDQLKTLIMDSREEKDIRAELTGLKETLNDLFDVLGAQKNRGISPHLSKVYCHLISGGISKQRTFKLMEELKNACSAEELKSYHNTLKIAENIIKQSISASYKGMEKKERYHNSLKRIVAFVGPAGSGKTTTLAKLAARYLLKDRLNVALVTTDTYRIGAAEQLKIYAEIMDIPIGVASEKEEFKRILNRFADRDIVLVDTPGKSRNDENYLPELKDFFDTGLPVETNLVLSVTTNQENMIDAAARFGITGYNNMIFTKIDDADSFGSIYNVIDHVGKPVFYIANGQNVPRDLKKMDPAKLARLIVGRGKDC